NTFVSRLRKVAGIEVKDPLDLGLSRINARLGMHVTHGGTDPSKPANSRVDHTETRARSIFFAPDMVVQADSVEVVWVWAPTEGPSSPPTDRAILLVGRTRSTVLGLLISPNSTHADDDARLAIGSGEWDDSRRQCWVRLDRVLEVSEEQVRRRGILFPERRFERIANRLRQKYHWG